MKKTEFTLELYDDEDAQEVLCKIIRNPFLDAIDVESITDAIYGESHPVPKEGTAEYAAYVAIEALAGDNHLKRLRFDVDGRLI